MSDDRPLAALRVLDLSRLLPGPFATMMLADMGAQVDKVEDPGGGDYLRLMPPQVEGMNAVFHALGRGKRSLVLDLKKPEGRDALLRLLPRYDVMVESFRPGVLERLGLGWDTLHEAHPGLVVAAITGYGKDGPMAGRAGHDLNYLARAGVLGMTGPEDGPPQVPGVQMADIGGGAMFALGGLLAALYARERTGEGRYVDVSMCEGSLAFATFGLMSRFGGMQTPRGGDVLMGGIAPYNTYATKDGEAVTLGALEPKFWNAFCAGVGLEADMSALAPGPHQKEWKDKLTAIFAERTREQWIAFAEQHDCCLEPVLHPDEVTDDAQHRARGVFVKGPAEAGGLPQPRTPLGTPAEGARAPAQGEHTREILGEAGFSDDEIEALAGAGATK
ncbi:MAG: CaiB/BaiF CoA transferase family protein [Polyangiales bacterium]